MSLVSSSVAFVAFNIISLYSCQNLSVNFLSIHLLLLANHSLNRNIIFILSNNLHLNHTKEKLPVKAVIPLFNLSMQDSSCLYMLPKVSTHLYHKSVLRIQCWCLHQITYLGCRCEDTPLERYLSSLNSLCAPLD